ncbi:LOW QUALITY PROTEIN: uncharacterized protein LOC142529255 [Primulina tabacum]|uniref:LOW QUALITY PROTEIN: uncharacterized protein LOC142529255 n=1 Tax=Primulina tabacum TaxID=48773 RepID=UPI003F597592
MSLRWSPNYGSNWSTKPPAKAPRACVSQQSGNGLRMNLKCNASNENLRVGITNYTHSRGDDSTLPPLVRALKALAEENDASFEFPGHNRGRLAPSSLTQLIGKLPFVHDLQELDNLYVPEGPLLEAQEKAAELFGASETWFLVGGTTCGVQAEIMATCMPGDTLILPRNAHFSAVSGMVLSGAVPKYIIPEYDPEWDIPGGIIPLQAKNAIKELEMENRKPAAVLVVSPSYHGICSDIGAITNLCHSRNIPIMVDEAHGAHFPLNHQLPSHALSQGADPVVQSTHKVLCSLTLSSMLRAWGNLIDRNRVRKSLQILQSSSPSALLLASLDAARAHLSDNRGTAFNEAIDFAFAAKRMINEIPGISILDLTNFPKFPAIDPLRDTIGVWNLGLSGCEANKILCTDFKLFLELVGTSSLTLIFNLGTTREHILRLVSGLRYLSATFLHSDNIEKVATEVIIPAPFDEIDMILNPREAFFARKKKVRIEDSVGEICGELICPYPPGIPVLIPGEVVTETALKYLLHVKSKGATINGATDGLLSSIVVCDAY